MKKALFITIFLFFAVTLSVSAEGSNLFLTNQRGEKTTQFSLNDDIYIEGVCLPANQGTGKIFITNDKIWQENEKLSDISGSIEPFTTSADGTVPRTQIWKAFNEGSFDVLIDTNSDYTLQSYEKQCALGLVGAGFQVGNPTPPPAPSLPPSAPPIAPAVSEPEPEPETTPIKPSTKFSINENILTNDISNIRKTAGGKTIGTQEEEAKGIIIGGPTQASLGGKKFWFWNINFEKDPDGWVSESNLKSVPKSEIATTLPVEETAIKENATAEKKDSITKKMLAQISSAYDDLDFSSFSDSVIIGLAIFLGLISGSMIIARAINPNFLTYTKYPKRPNRSPRKKVRKIKKTIPIVSSPLPPAPPGQI